jgi:hypothetical protein
VSVDFGSTISIKRAEVLHAPCAPGDSWRLKLDSGRIVYVQSFEAMWLKNKS